MMADRAARLLMTAIDSGNRQEFDDSIDLLRQVLGSAPANHPGRVIIVSNLVLP